MTKEPRLTSDLQMSRRIRRTPFTSCIEKLGVSGFTVVNHTLLPKSFKNSVAEDFYHLRTAVQIWDVGCQRQVEIEGPDALSLVQKMTPRNIANAEVGQCMYLALTNDKGKIINDPILLKLSDEKFWLSIADSDVLLWAKALAIGLDLNVSVSEPDVSPLAVQGPQAQEVMSEVFGKGVCDLNFFRFGLFDFKDTQQVISRTGYSSQDGYEIFLNDSKLGKEMWDVIWNVGAKYSMRPGGPNLIDRIEAGLISYGNDMTSENTPLECGMEKYCSLNKNMDFLGRDHLIAEKRIGPKRKIRGIVFSGKEQSACTQPWQLHNENINVGQITSGIFNPSLRVNTGIALIQKGSWNHGQSIKVVIGKDDIREGRVCFLPFTVQENREIIQDLKI